MSMSNNISIDVYLTDDGSTDGTKEAIQKRFPEVTILIGDGNLFWAEGMRNSWTKALQKDYDGYFLINDDVEFYDNVFEQLLATHEYSLTKFNKGGIYIGATEDKNLHKLTYSGSMVINKFLYTQKRLPPNGTFQKCELANANIMLVSKTVVDKIGILAAGYSHGMADYDYTLTANKHNIPVLIAPQYCGHCVNDHKDKYEGFSDKTFEERKIILYSPTGLAFKSYLSYVQKFFPFRYPFVLAIGWLKLYYPQLYFRLFKNR
jgi:GT2 family glycosyltransferase